MLGGRDFSRFAEVDLYFVRVERILFYFIDCFGFDESLACVTRSIVGIFDRRQRPAPICNARPTAPEDLSPRTPEPEKC